MNWLHRPAPVTVVPLMTLHLHWRTLERITYQLAVLVYVCVHAYRLTLYSLLLDFLVSTPTFIIDLCTGGTTDAAH